MAHMCVCVAKPSRLGCILLSMAAPRPVLQVRAAQHLLSEKGSILDIPREMSACMADGKYMDLVKLYRKAHTTYSSSILSKVHVLSTSKAKFCCGFLFGAETIQFRRVLVPVLLLCVLQPA